MQGRGILRDAGGGGSLGWSLDDVYTSSAFKKLVRHLEAEEAGARWGIDLDSLFGCTRIGPIA